jgi:hypothetical protein
VQQVAQRYFSDDRLTVAVLDPLPLDSTTEHTATAESGHAH